jgi:signal transduction histidine kinase/DNA-binding response OmpR family regulator
MNTCVLCNMLEMKTFAMLGLFLFLGLSSTSQYHRIDVESISCYSGLLISDPIMAIVALTNLSPRATIFQLKRSNNAGVWNENGGSLFMVFHPSWWNTIYAWVGHIVILVLTVGGLIRWRLWQLYKEKADLEKQVYLRTQQIESQKREILSQNDLLEQKNGQITKLDQLKNKFFTNVSHELRTPLTLIQIPVEDMLDDPHCTEKVRGKLNTVRRNTRRLLNLVNQFLDISKIDGSKMKLELIESDVIKHLRAISGAFTALAETKSIQYRCHYSSEERLTWFDPDKLEKIAGNLLSNAFKFTPEGGEISFMAEYKREEDFKKLCYIEFAVTDNGSGIPLESLDKIFDCFYQVEESVKTENGGAGIGLSLARDMARLQHGDITVNSMPGSGSKFIVKLPLGKDHLNESEFTFLNTVSHFFNSKDYLPEGYEESYLSRLEEDNPESSSEKPVVLIVEDNRDTRILLADNLLPEYSVREAIDGVAGLKKAREIIPDLIITDLMMPRMDGIELCSHIKADELTSHIPVIMLTARVATEDKITCLQTGADDYMPKPFHMNELKARMDNLIENRKKLRERFSREVTLEPKDIAITSVDEKFLHRAIEVVEKHLSEENFGLQVFQEEMNMSRSTLFRKLYALTNQSPTEFIRTVRLKRASSLLKQHFGNISQVAAEVGITNPSYFTKCFRKIYGVSPVDYAKNSDFITTFS